MEPFARAIPLLFVFVALARAAWVWLAPRHDARPVRAFEPYLLAQLVHAFAGGFLLLVDGTLIFWVCAVLSGLVLSTLFTVAAFFARKAWAAPVEGVRTFVVACVLAGLDALGQISPAIAALGYVPALVSLGACIALASHAND